jgi:dTDP-4-amino-4,6-dideoxygalactose transaminase
MIKIPRAAIAKFEANYPEIFETGNLAEGKWNKALARFAAQYTGVKHAVPFSSNGSGTLAVLMLLKRHRGYKRVFIQSNTMYGVKTTSVSSGLDLIGTVPCTVTHLMPTAPQLKEFLRTVSNPSDCVFLMTHIGGVVNPDSVEIAQICKDNGVALVEDCAHSLGATLDGRHTGSFGVAGVYSLYATKAITAGEGGIAVTNDDDLARLLEKFQIYDRFDQVEEIGVNFRISELHALFSFSICELSEQIISNKAAIAKRYVAACLEAGIEFVDPFGNGQRGNHYKFSIIAKENAAEEFSEIKNRTSPVYDYTLGPDPDSLHTRHVCLPIWYGLEESVIAATVSQVVQAGHRRPGSARQAVGAT